MTLEATNERTWWWDAELALEEHTALVGRYDDDQLMTDDEDVNGDNSLSMRLLEGRSRIFYFPDGDIHYCDNFCQYAIAGCDINNRPNGDFVCKFTGRVIKRYCEERTDNSTGRSFTLGTDPETTKVHRFHRRDMKRISILAYKFADTLKDSEMPSLSTAPQSAKRTVKPPRRAAECVKVDCSARDSDISLTPHVSTKRLDVVVKPHEKIRRDAETLLIKLTGTIPGAKRAPTDEKLTIALKRPELMCSSVLFKVALRKYLVELSSVPGRQPSLDEISNISLSVHAALELHEERQKNGEIKTRARPPLDAQLRLLVSQLAASLFDCALKTPYMVEQKKGSRAFRPFCVGVYYAFKRGIVLSDGRTLVPRLSDIAEALLENRSGSTAASIQSMHSSAHRGLCVLQRSINSVPAHELACVFGSATRIAERLEAQT
jgi:hypothetical protein